MAAHKQRGATQKRVGINNTLSYIAPMFDRDPTLQSDLLATLGAHLTATALRAPQVQPETHLDRQAFLSLAVRVVRHQLEHNRALSRFAAQQGCAAPPDNPFDVPPVPTDAFKHATLTTFSAADAAVCFRSSGTTASDRGRHFLRTLQIYEASIRPPFRWYMLPDAPRMHMLVAMPPAHQAPASSLAYMLDLVRREFGTAESTHIVDADGQLDTDTLRERFATAEACGEPLFLLGPSFAWVHLLDAQPRLQARLPAGSRLFETGGYKGKSRTVPRQQLHRELLARLGLHPHMIAGEYGMSELSSQLYEPVIRYATQDRDAQSVRGMYVPPPWCAVRVVDPVTLQPVPTGEVGQVSMLDLANLDSVAHIVTGDLGRLVPTETPTPDWGALPPGVAGLELLGRAADATPKGCSLAMDALLTGDRELAP